MKLLILADLHFDETNEWVFINSITQKMISRVNNKAQWNEELIIVILGDLVYRGGQGDIQSKFDQTSRFIEILKSEYSNVKFLFIPGNHEIIGTDEELTKFNEFCRQYSYKNEVQFTKQQSVYAFEEDGINIILADSTLNRKHDAEGKIDTQAIAENINIKKKNLVFMHHPPCEIDGVDRSVVNSKELIATKSNFIFYGHQHGGAVEKDFLQGDTDIHTVGTLFRQEPGAIHEFLLLDIMDGKINFAYRYTYNGNVFMPNILFPWKSDLKSHNLQLSCPDVTKNKVERKLILMVGENENEQHNNGLWSQFQGLDIESVLKKHNKLLIIGDAGIGKSYELSMIYELFKEDDEYFPLWVNIRNTNYYLIKQNIEYARQNTIDKKLPCLIIDGLDELNSNEITAFIQDIGAATEGNPEVKIVISVRTNFKVLINGFIEYKILPLDTKQINDIAIMNGVSDVAHFSDSLNSSGCTLLAQIPFYLFDIIQLYVEKGKLPNRNQIFNKIISHRFKKGDDKFVVEQMKKLMTNEFQVREWLKELSFFMQSQLLFLIDNISYTQYFTTDKRDFFDRTGLISCIKSEYGQSWEFNHNIFREYFVADYISKLPFDELLDLITFDASHKKLRPSWINTVSFVFSLRKEEDLKEWLIENAKEALIQFEPDRLDEEERNKVFISIMEDSLVKEIPLYAYLDEVKLSRYFQSQTTIEYIINILKKSCSERTILSCLSILRHCTSFFEKEDELKEVILAYLNPDTSEYVTSRAVSALANIKSFKSKCALEDIFPYIKNDNRADVIEAVSKLILVANVSDDYFDYILDKLKQKEVYKEKIYAHRRLENAASTFRKVESITKTLDFLAIGSNAHSHYNDDELFQVLLVNAAQLDINNTLLLSILNIFIKVTKQYNRRKAEYIKNFFVETKTLDQAFSLLLELSVPKESIMFAIELIMDESLTEILIKSYTQGNVDSSVYKWYISRLPEESDLFISLNDAVREKEGIDVQRSVIIDWVKIQRQSQQIYFDSLFNRDKFGALIHELSNLINANIKCNDLFDEVFDKIPSTRLDLQSVLSTLYHWGGDLPTANFLDYIEWETFSISKICDLLKSKEILSISIEQETKIREYYDTQLNSINYDILDEKNPKCNKFYWHIENVIFLMKKLNFPCDDSKLLDMIVLPWTIFSSSTVSSQSEALKFITEKLSESYKLKERILKNLETKVLSPSAAQAHIIYCLEQNLPQAIKIAEELIMSTEEHSKWFKNTAIDYLIAIRGESYVDELIDHIDQPDVDLLNHLAYKMKAANRFLIAKLIEGNENSMDYMLHLANLIKLNTQYGVRKYIEIVKKENKLPDTTDDKQVICSVTEAIREIGNIELLDSICELLVISHSEKFIDNEYFGLKSSLGNAVSKLIQADANKVKKSLLALAKQHSNNKNLISSINWYLRDAEVLLSTSSDLAWTIDKTLEFIKHHKNVTIL